MNHPRLRLLGALAAGTLALAVALGPPGGTRVEAQVQPPPPPVPNGTPNALTSAPAATPLPSSVPIPSGSPGSGPSHAATASAAPGGRRGRRSKPVPAPAESSNPEPSATPTSPAFATLDGTWEMQLQYINRTEYSYLVIHQNAAGTLSGAWRVKGKSYPLDGTYDGRLIRMSVKQTPADVTLSGYVEGASDMVGTLALDGAKGDPTAFTAEHRAKPGLDDGRRTAPRRSGG